MDIDADFRVDLLTREYPPYVYGGAGVHVAELSKVLAGWLDVRVQCFDGPRQGMPGVHGFDAPNELDGVNLALGVFGTDLRLTAAANGANLVHSHTWYANLAGHLAGMLYDIPHVVTAHSLEPLRPWKAEQLGGGYALSSWAEKTAYEAADAVIAVSASMREDILACYPNIDPDRVRVVHNGIDVEEWHRSSAAQVEEVRARYGLSAARPTLVFVGRITRQKGLPHLLRAARELPHEVQVVLCAGAPDTPQIAQEVRDLVEELRDVRDTVVWIEENLTRSQRMGILSAATVFVCPSVYEPLGIVNLEAMACGVPVVGTATGGIPEVIVEGETGWLVPIDQVSDGSGTPIDQGRFVEDLATSLTQALADPERAAAYGRAARRRVELHFSWETVAERTVDVYRSVVAPY